MEPGWRVAAIAAGAIVFSALAGCSAQPAQTPSDAATVSPSATPRASATPTAPIEYDPEGGAMGNKEYFDLVMRELVAQQSRPDGRTIIDRLVDSGFAKADMEVTVDKTAIGLDVDAIEFSVRLESECLVGQIGIQGYASILAPALSTGRCLVGKTRPIDW